MSKLTVILLVLSLSGVSCGMLPGHGHHDGDEHHGNHEPAVSAEDGATMLDGGQEQNRFGNVDRWADLMRDRD